MTTGPDSEIRPLYPYQFCQQCFLRIPCSEVNKVIIYIHSQAAISFDDSTGLPNEQELSVLDENPILQRAYFWQRLIESHCPAREGIEELASRMRICNRVAIRLSS